MKYTILLYVTILLVIFAEFQCPLLIVHAILALYFVTGKFVYLLRTSKDIYAGELIKSFFLKDAIKILIQNMKNVSKF